LRFPRFIHAKIAGYMQAVTTKSATLSPISASVSSFFPDRISVPEICG
jgi:hypothetical protein